MKSEVRHCHRVCTPTYYKISSTWWKIVIEIIHSGLLHRKNKIWEFALTSLTMCYLVKNFTVSISTQNAAHFRLPGLSRAYIRIPGLSSLVNNFPGFPRPVQTNVCTSLFLARISSCFMTQPRTVYWFSMHSTLSYSVIDSS